MSYKETSEVYDIHYLVIYRHVKNSNIRTQGGQSVLTTLEENTVVLYILLCAEWRYPLDSFDVRYLEKDIWISVAKR